eukprot:scaffold72891_cov27-Tisochrysis_lutea.AAC.1
MRRAGGGESARRLSGPAARAAKEGTVWEGVLQACAEGVMCAEEVHPGLAHAVHMPRMSRLRPLLLLLCAFGGDSLRVLRLQPATLLVQRSLRVPTCCAPLGPSVDDRSAALDTEEPDKQALCELQRCVKVAELECLAQECEATGDLKGEVAAYEELLSIEPPEAHWLSASTSARRGLQELLLESAYRELAACGEDGCKPAPPTLLKRVEQAGEATRRQLASRALSDVGRIRKLVVGLLDRGESEAKEDASRAEDAISYLRLVEGEPAIVEM